MTRTCFLALALLLTPSLATAQELLGTITATLGNGAAQTWYVTADGDQSQSALTKIPGVALYGVSLWGNTDENVTATLKGALLLDFMVMSSGSAPNVIDPTLQFLEDGYAGIYLAGSDGDIGVTITRFEEGDTAVEIAGEFTATAAFSDNSATLETDPSNTLPIAGGFNVTLQIQ